MPNCVNVHSITLSLYKREFLLYKRENTNAQQRSNLRGLKMVGNVPRHSFQKVKRPCPKNANLKATPYPFKLAPRVFRHSSLSFPCSWEGGVGERRVGIGNEVTEDPSCLTTRKMTSLILTQWSSQVPLRTAGASDLAGFTPQPVIGNYKRQGHRSHEYRRPVY